MVREADQGQQGAGAFLAFPGRDAAQPHGYADVLGGGEDRYQAEGLEDEADAVAAQGEQVRLAQGRQVGALDADPPARRGVEAADEVQQGGLAGARPALEGGEFAPADLEGHAAQGVDGLCSAAEAVVYVVHGHDRCAAGLPRRRDRGRFLVVRHRL